ncbi:MAG TPA: hypothetical protein VIK91_08175, partial [Nannocystis sp.]
GWYDPENLLYETGREERAHTTKCASSDHAQLPNFIRERYGLPLLEDGVFREWKKNKKKNWDKRYEPPKDPAESKDSKDGKAQTPAKAAGPATRAPARPQLAKPAEAAKTAPAAKTGE